MDQGFAISIENVSSTCRLRCSGSLGASTSDHLREAIDICLEREPKRIEIDLSEVDHVSIAGLRVLCDASLKSAERGAELRLLTSDEVRDVLDSVGLWWLGVVDDASAMRDSIGAAMKTYADLHFLSRARARGPQTGRGGSAAAEVPSSRSSTRDPISPTGTAS